MESVSAESQPTVSSMDAPVEIVVKERKKRQKREKSMGWPRRNDRGKIKKG
jgi:hypothetical protein